LSIRVNRRETPQGVIVELHGRLSHEVLGEFGGLCDAIRAPFSLDLSGLATADEAGLRALRAWLAAGVRVEGASPYIRLLLESDDPAGGHGGSPRRE
jgi:hypothetical protein